MKRIIQTVTTSFLMIAMFSGCKKDGSNPIIGSSKAALLTSTSWKYSKLEYQNQDGTWYSASPLPNDAAEVSLAFNADGSFTDAGGWDPHTGTWKISSDGNTLTTETNITYGTRGSTANSTINTLSSSTLQISTTGTITETGADGWPHKFYAERDTFVH